MLRDPAHGNERSAATPRPPSEQHEQEHATVSTDPYIARDHQLIQRASSGAVASLDTTSTRGRSSTNPTAAEATFDGVVA